MWEIAGGTIAGQWLTRSPSDMINAGSAKDFFPIHQWEVSLIINASCRGGAHQIEIIARRADYNALSASGVVRPPRAIYYVKICGRMMNLGAIQLQLLPWSWHICTSSSGSKGGKCVRLGGWVGSHVGQEYGTELSSIVVAVVVVRDIELPCNNRHV